MEIQLINDVLLAGLHKEAKASDRKRQNFDLRTSPDDSSQRMLNVLEVGTHIPIHRHLRSSETVVCLEGCFDEVFFEELSNMDAGVPMHKGEMALDETCFKEVARFRVCPREGIYGIQVPKMAWHTLEVHEPSTIFESKDGAYVPLGPEEVRG